MKIGFKIIDLFRRTNTLEIYDELLENQWSSPSKIEEQQFNNLKKLLIHANENVPFYQKRFREYDFNPSKFNEFSDLNVIPIISKDDVRNNFEEFKASNFEIFKPRLTQTGGSTGKPFLTYKDKMSHSYLWANNFRGWNSAGYNLGDKFIQIATGSLLPNTNSLKNRVYNYFQNSKLIPSYHLTDEVLADIVNSINVSKGKFIYGYSSSLALLASYCIENEIKIESKLEAVFTSSDMLYPNQRKNIEDAFNTKVFDIYGCPEAGILTFECKEHDGYHINQESAFISIDNAGSEGIGNIISTPLFNFAFPLIWYNTGDVGKISDKKCNCGRGLNKISELGGRIRDFVILSDGRYIHGAFFNHLDTFYNASWIKQYQIIQESIDEITIKFSCADEPDNGDLSKIEQSLKKGLLPNIKINFDFSGVEYTKGGKFRLIISKVKNEWE